MEPEKDYGNIEYKLKFNNSTAERIEELTSQLRFRMEEGNYECIYKIGIHDNGDIVGLNLIEYEETMKVIKLICEKNKYIISSIYEHKVDEYKNVYEILIREYNESKYTDIKVAIAGNVNASKSSLLGVLIGGKLDDGRGSARTSVFNFQHEIKSGMTSSIAHHILGFDVYGNIVNYDNKFGKMSWTDIVKNSSKIISFSDLAGHEKYFKTTILGLASTFPDVCMILVESISDKITRMTKEHIFLCLTLNIPFVIIMTKIDLIENRKNVYVNTLNELLKILKMPGIRKTPFKIKDESDIRLCAEKIYTNEIAPIFQISNVSGKGISDIKMFLNLLGKRDKNYNIDGPVEHYIDTIFNVKGVGIVVGGNLLSGTIKIGDKLYIGPDFSGLYTIVTIKSIYCKKTPIQEISHSTYVCLGIKGITKENIRKGHVILSHNLCKSVNEFVVDMRILKSHSTTIKNGYEPTIHTYSIRQTAKLVNILKKISDRNDDEPINLLKIGDKAIVKFKFKYRPEYLKVGSIIFISEGQTKAIGIIKEIS